jgi:hypothetical protein
MLKEIASVGTALLVSAVVVTTAVAVSAAYIVVDLDKDFNRIRDAVRKPIFMLIFGLERDDVYARMSPDDKLAVVMPFVEHALKTTTTRFGETLRPMLEEDIRSSVINYIKGNYK